MGDRGAVSRFVRGEKGAISLEWLALLGIVLAAGTAVLAYVGPSMVHALETAAEEDVRAHAEDGGFGMGGSQGRSGGGGGGGFAVGGGGGASEPRPLYYPDRPEHAFDDAAATAAVSIGLPGDLGGAGAFEPDIAEPAAGGGAAPSLGALRLGTDGPGISGPGVSLDADAVCETGGGAGADNPWLSESLRVSNGCGGAETTAGDAPRP
ncbi:MAG: hypothetical protein ACFBWO_09840 [Paracoccaceae bacterium]